MQNGDKVPGRIVNVGICQKSHNLFKFKFYFICTIHKYLQSKIVMIYISIIQTGFRRKSKDLFESVSLTCSIAKMMCVLCFVRVCLYVLCGHLLGKG